MSPLARLLCLGTFLLVTRGFAADPATLARVLRDPAADLKAKSAACEQLMGMGAAAAPAVPALAALLDAKEEILRDYAVTTLSKIGPAAKDALPALRKTLTTDVSPDIRELARGAIGKIDASGVVASPARTPQPAAAPTVTPPVAKPATTTVRSQPVRSTRPPLVDHQGRYFRWSSPVGWREDETANGVSLTAPNGVTSVSSLLLMRSPGATTPVNFVQRMMTALPGFRNARVLSVQDQPDQPSGYGVPWKVQVVEMAFDLNGQPARASFTVGIVSLFGRSYDAFMLLCQAPAAEYDEASLWLAPIAQSVTITNPGAVAGNDTLITPKNRPLDNSALIESWRQKGLSEDRISKARREGTMGYERAKDPATGRIYNMPLETWDGTVGGYRNPERPTEILQRTKPGE